jgi:NAD+ kinase
MRVGVIANVTRPGMAEALGEIENWAAAGDHTVLYDATLADHCPKRSQLVEADSMSGKVDLILAMGGDGTILRAARIVGQSNVPIMGVNLGSLGFLTQIAPAELPAILPRLAAGDYRRESRTILEMTLPGNHQPFYALNELTVDRGGGSRAIEIRLEVDDELVCRYIADGLIIATPTGSTAYALSAGGPVTVPALRALIVVPVAPHTLAQRPIVVPDDVVLKLTSDEPNIEVSLTMDGRKAAVLKYGQSCTVRRAGFEVILVRFPERSFYQLVRTKLHWGVNPRHAHRDDRVV